MSFLPFIVFGIVAGSVYGLAAMGLVLTYKTSGIFNFAQGGVAAAAAFTYYELHVEAGWPSWLALLVAVPGFGIVAGLVLEVVARGMAQASAAYKIVGTVGILLMLVNGSGALFGSQQRPFPTFMPTGTFTVGGTFVRADQIITTVIAGACALGLYLFFRLTRVGTAMRAVVDDPQLLDITGTDPVRIRRYAWIIGSSFAALSGVLIAPVLGLDPLLLTLLVVQAFGAAAVGAFTNLPLCYAGGILVGLISNILPKYTSDSPALQGLPQAVPFLVLFVALLITPVARLREPGRATRPAPQRVSSLTTGQRRTASVGAVALLVAVPFLVGSRLAVYSNALTYVILFLSLGLLVRTSGQVSLCHIGFQAIGAATFTHLLVLPWPVAVLVAGLAAVPLGLLVALPAIRLSPLYLALATFGLGILLEYLFYGTSFMFGGASGRRAPRPHLSGLSLDSDRGYYYVLLTAVALCVAMVVGIERARLGRLLRGLADSPLALGTHGVGVNSLRMLVFVISAFLAGISGALTGPLQQIATDVPFNYFNSLLLLAVLSIAVALFRAGTVPAAFIAAGLIAVLQVYVTDETMLKWLPVMFGMGALAAALLSGAGGRRLVLLGDRERPIEDLRRTPYSSRQLEASSR